MNLIEKAPYSITTGAASDNAAAAVARLADWYFTSHFFAQASEIFDYAFTAF